MIIRIVLAEGPRLLADLIRSEISTRADMAIVEEVDGDQNLHAVVTKADAQVVVTSLTGPRVPPEYQRLLFGSRCMALVTISRDARYAAVYDRKVLREVAVEQLAQAIREVAQQRDVPGVSDKLM